MANMCFFLSLLCAFFKLKILIVWKIWLILTADKTKRRHRCQNVIIWLNVQWFIVDSVQRRIRFRKKPKGWDCRPVHNEAQHDCEIIMTLDFDFWLMPCSREEFSFRNIYVSMFVHVGTKQPYTHQWFKKYRFETLFEDDIVKVRNKRQYFLKFVSVCLVVFSNVTTQMLRSIPGTSMHAHSMSKCDRP